MNNIALLKGDTCYFSDNTPRPVLIALNEITSDLSAESKEKKLLALISDWPNQLDIHIALYKLYFRTGRYTEAERQVWKTLNEAARQAGFSSRYNQLKPDTADWLGDHSIARLYLFSLKALGVIRLRRNKIKPAISVLSKLLELDPQDEIGGRNFLDIAESVLEQEVA